MGIIASATDAIITVDDEQKVTLFNVAAERMFRCPASEAIGRPLDRFIPHRFREIHHQHIRDFAQTGVTTRAMGHQRPLAALRADGVEFPVEATISQITVRGQRLFTAIVRDVTERRKAEEVLRESEGRLRAIVETAVDGIITIDERGLITSFNPAATRIFGYAPAEVLGRNVNMLMPSPYREEHDAYLDNYHRTGEKKIIGIGREVTGRRKDGTVFPLDLAVSETVLGDRRIFTGIVRDISEQKQAEGALRDREARIRAIVDTAVDAIITIDESGRIESVNPATERLFGYARDEMVGQNVKLLMPEPYRGEHDGYLRRYLRTGKARIIGIGREVVGLRKDGSTVPLNLSVSEFRLGGRRMFTGILHDFTERRRLEREVLDVSSAEQRRIGQDLHDGLCQELVGVAFATKLLAGRLQTHLPDEATSARDVAALVDGAIDQARTLAHGLSPVELQGGDLAAALEALALKVSGLFQVVCQCRCDEKVILSDGSTATHLYRIAQEAVNNAVKHGKARRIDIGITSSEAWVTLSVKDDGRGIPAVLPETAGIGLSTMSYRARVIGGSFSVQPGPRRGTVVTCVVPRPATQDRPATKSAESKRKRGGRRASSHSSEPAPSKS
jgi:PAS domain S-box-containing protein